MKNITCYYSIILSLFFLISCQTFEVTQATKTKVQGGRPNSPSFYEYEVYLTLEKGNALFTKVIINNTIQKSEFSVKNNETKKSSMNTQNVQEGTYILSYKLKEDQVKAENDTVEIIFQHNGKEQKVKTIAHFTGKKRLK